MMGKYKGQQLCMFGPCGGQHLQLEEEDRPLPIARMQSPKKTKTSLKRATCRNCSVLAQTHHKVHSPPSTILQASKRLELPPMQHVQPRFTVQVESRPVYIPERQVLTPKPKINFSWNDRMDQTIKKELKEEAVQPALEPQNELEKTKPTNKLLSAIKNRSNLHKASVISIQDVTPKGAPKVEESVVMVDYFNPNQKQLSQLEEFFEKKEMRQSF